ncbi:Kinesin-1 heavy chain [Didymosphaeria variabile]|uniref:Kinesin-1 heavy chain n=1 Tax=Didymosphaeria variabile TaxID=1932322 RepID=A0A9W8X8Y0_9PLEO|nr:Kinesin-1 heavy chain [Didymosphaeria variabile]KAJ4344361.1 Kinesin-1 heavy chain [Didymosphaeria variabile]
MGIEEQVTALTEDLEQLRNRLVTETEEHDQSKVLLQEEQDRVYAQEEQDRVYAQEEQEEQDRVYAQEEQEEQDRVYAQEEPVENLEEKINGQLFPVDLAGSEKAGKTGASGQIVEEANNV